MTTARAGGKRPIETEIKLAVPGVVEARRMLRAAGFRVVVRRVFEQNIVLDDAGRSLRERGLLLRVRAAGKRVSCTYKGPLLPGRHKKRVEEEFLASDLEACLGVFAGLGFRESMRYEKYRTELERPGEAGRVTLDETPIGVYLELEGEAGWIDRTREQLGFGPEAAIKAGYITMYLDWCAKRGKTPGSMRFGKKQRG